MEAIAMNSALRAVDARARRELIVEGSAKGFQFLPDLIGVYCRRLKQQPRRLSLSLQAGGHFAVRRFEVGHRDASRHPCVSRTGEPLGCLVFRILDLAAAANRQ
jgi:hypothetical protein